MALLRKPEYCPKCGKQLMEKHKDQSDLPQSMRVIGDTFIGYYDCTCGKTMEQNNIPTAKNFIRKKLMTIDGEEPQKVMFDGHVEQKMIEFAKLHVKAALQAAAEKAVATSWTDQDGLHQEVDEDSILNAYPENLIK